MHLETIIMNKSLSIIVLGIVAVSTFLLAPMAHAFYDNFPTENIQFHPQNPDYYDGNLRLKLKSRADIERASAPNVHYSKTDGDYYTCSWKYNTNLGTWVCDKNLAASAAKSVDICPFGYILNPNKKCSAVNVPANAHLNSRGDGWECDSGFRYVGSGCIGGVTSSSTTKYIAVISQPEQIQMERYVYYYDEDSNQDPVQVKTVTYKMPGRLAATGAGIGFTLISGLIGTLGYIVKRKFF